MPAAQICSHSTPCRVSVANKLRFQNPGMKPRNIGSCRCGRIHQGGFPVYVTPHVSYGVCLKSYAVGLASGHFVSAQRVCLIIRDQYGIQPSNGSVQKWLVTGIGAASGRLRSLQNGGCPGRRCAFR